MLSVPDKHQHVNTESQVGNKVSIVNMVSPVGLGMQDYVSGLMCVTAEFLMF